MSKPVLVIGGGIVGLLAAARHRDAGDDVVLVDSGPLGGLLRSEEVAPGVWVDHGTHVPQEVGIPSLDRWLFGALPEHGWARHPRVLAGTSFGGAVDERTPFPDLNRCPPEVCAELQAGLLGTATGPGDGGDAEPARTSAEELDRTFGSPIRTRIFEPLLRRWYGTGAEELGPGAHRLAANRVVAFTPEETAILKDARPDLAVAWHDAAIGSDGRTAHYPVDGGAGAWVAHLRGQLDGVEVLEGTRLALEAGDGRIHRATTRDGRELAVGAVVSTVAPAVVALMLGRRPSGARPRMVRTLLVDLVVDRPLGTGLHCFTLFDPGSVAFRVTLYPNLRGRAEDGPFALTAEVLGGELDGAVDEEGLVDAVRRELVELGVIDPRAGVVHQGVRHLASGFPVPPVDADPTAGLRDLADLGNVGWFGRAAGGGFFLAEVLADAHARLPPPVEPRSSDGLTG